MSSHYVLAPSRPRPLARLRGAVLATAVATAVVGATVVGATVLPAQAQVSIPAFGPVGHNGPITVAHRGNSGERPENTLLAIRSAIEAGADYVEVDVRQTKDPDGSGPDTPATVLMHDGSFGRTSDVNDVFPARQNDDVGTFTRGETFRLDAGSWNDKAYAGTPIPSLKETLAEVQGTNTGVLFEFKDTDRYPGIINRSVDVIRDWAAQNPGHPLAVASIDNGEVRALKAAAPGIPRGVLAKDPTELTDAQLADIATYADFMGVRTDVVSAQSVRRVQAAGMRVIHNTSTRSAMVTSEANGADGTMTDYPRRKRETIAGRRVVTNEAESLTARSSASVRSRPNEFMNGGKFSGLGANTWMQMWESADNDWMALDLSVPTAGTYEVKVVLIKGCAVGIYNADLDGTRVLTGFDGFRPGCDRVARDTVSLGRHTLSAGTHTVRFEVTGKAANSSGYRVSLDVFELHPI